MGVKAKIRRALLCVLLVSSSSASPRYSVDWNAAGSEVLDRLAALIRINSTNPPGNETRVANAVKAMLAREGIPAELFALEPGRANLVARIRGNGSKRPLLLMGHTDTVGVQRAMWSVNPFAAVRQGGFLYGRGAVDDKDHVAAAVTILALLQRLHVKLDRDVIFLAEAGEEGSTRIGIDYMVRQHWPEIGAEFAIAEGGGIIEESGRQLYVLAATTEKTPHYTKLSAHGPSGHGSRPIAGNAVVHLAEAVARAGTWQTPLRLNPTTRAYFARIAQVLPAPQAERYRALLDPARAAEADRYLRDAEPGSYAMLHTTVVPTVLRAGFRTNVIPAEAEAELDVRALPDEDMARFYAELRRTIDDPTVQVSAEGGGRPSAAPSRTDTALFRALEETARQMFRAPVIPEMLPGATDNAQLRAKGVQAYGVGPAATPGDGAHADNERIGEHALLQFTEFLWRTVLAVAASPQ